MVESVIYFLMKTEDKNIILQNHDILCSLLLKLVQYESVFRNNHQLLLNLEHLIKIVFYSSVKLSRPAGMDFVKYLLKGGGKNPPHESTEFKKLGIFSLYCIALGLQENKKCRNIDFF